MKQIMIISGLICVMATGLISCYKDVILPDTVVDPEGTPQFVSYKSDLMPLFNSHCALSGCHVSGGHHPYMNSDISYVQIVNNGYVNTIVPKQSVLYLKINGEMKEYIPSAVDRQKVYDWIRNGAPNN